jgi:exodeoxyribonuclease III
VLAGDVNIAPEDRDVWDPAVFVGSTHVTPDERARLRAIEAVGLVDAYRAVDPGGTGYTFWDYRLGALRRNLGMRIDLVLVSHQLVVTGCEVDGTYRRVNRAGDKPSDHAPLLVELERPAGG